MVGKLKFLLLYFFVWVFFFECDRLLFLLYYFSRASQLPFHTNALTFLYGLRMDVAMAAYILFPVVFFVIAGIFLPWFRKTTVYTLYTCLLLFFVLLIVISDLEIYANWGFRIDATPLRYLQSPREAWASVSHLPILLILTVFLLLYISLCFLFRRFIKRIIVLLHQPARKLSGTFILLLIAALLVIPMRGGLQQIPINQSSVYFSQYNFANVTAINAVWNLMDGLWNMRKTSNPYHYMDGRRARAKVDSLYEASGEVQQLLKTDRPNVILVIWESFTEKATHAVIGGREVTPGFNRLKKEGVYFSGVFASGDRTDKGLGAVLGGYPALNSFSIIRVLPKAAKLNTLGNFFKERGYPTSFYYGGEPEFANIKSFVLQSHYDKLIEKSDFSKKDQNSKWGAHDGVVANKLLSETGRTGQPFFTTWLTLSSHEPFETPVPATFAGKDVTTLFQNSIHYTDNVLYNMVEECKKLPWWDNTLFIIIADHGHPLIEPSNTLNNFRIPMLWLGGALSKTGITIDKVCSQVDLAGTLTAQLGTHKNYFPFSKNILDSTSKPWAYFSFNNGFGMAQPRKAFVFDNIGKQVISREGAVTEKDVEAGKALQQYIYQDFIEK